MQLWVEKFHWCEFLLFIYLWTWSRQRWQASHYCLIVRPPAGNRSFRKSFAETSLSCLMCTYVSHTCNHTEKKSGAKMEPPWSRSHFEKCCHFEGWSRFFPLYKCFFDKNSSTFEGGAKIVPQWSWVTYHETIPGVEPFWLHFFSQGNLLVYCLSEP